MINYNHPFKLLLYDGKIAETIKYPLLVNQSTKYIQINL